MQEYESAERCVDRVLLMEPNNYQAKQLKELIVKKLRRGIYILSVYIQDKMQCSLHHKF